MHFTLLVDSASAAALVSRPLAFFGEGGAAFYVNVQNVSSAAFRFMFYFSAAALVSRPLLLRNLNFFLLALSKNFAII